MHDQGTSVELRTLQTDRQTDAWSASRQGGGVWQRLTCKTRKFAPN